MLSLLRSVAAELHESAGPPPVLVVLPSSTSCCSGLLLSLMGLMSYV